ncbi:glycoside hydrolase family 47 protein [Mycena maculata]|uniref:alpha-1,2-Mannosidase n=1 Tax=Mycena maculata TaxID=230809 RepID=A0AAD7K936_9AGAR|nr:glycoside hydrolase family 47 protein [Mycena maculata]
MGLTDLFEETLNYTATLDPNIPPVPQTISVFETNIRWVGGLLSAYELSGKQHPILVTKAKEFADKLAFAWVGDNVLPYNTMNFTINAPEIGTAIMQTNIAQIGTLDLEWAVLSKYTGNATYGKLTEDAVLYVAGLVSRLSWFNTGLAPQVIDPSTGQFDDAYIVSSDSYFEYLVKFARYTNNENPIFLDTWATAVDSSIHTLLKTTTVGDFSYLADQDDQGLIRHVGSHLACFLAGNWLLGGQLLQNKTIVDTALLLNDGTGIGPEDFAYISSDGNFTGGDPITPEQLAFYDRHGFYITTSDYIQRPEVLESNFYAWRVTGDTKYLDRALSAIASFNKWLPATVAFASLNDVNNFADGGFIDIMESFWYLTLDDPTHISLDTHVWNTECHPLEAPPALDKYTANLIPQKSFTPHITNQPRPAVSPIPQL